MMKKIIGFTILICALSFSRCTNTDHKKNTTKKTPPMVVANINQQNGKVNFFGLDYTKLAALNNTSNRMYSVSNKHAYSTTISQLKKANSISDIIYTYPTSWIKSYNSVQFDIVCGDKKIKLNSSNEFLNEAQKKLFNSCQAITEVIITISYNKKNSATNKLEKRMITYPISVVPHTPAKPINGYHKMISYFKEKSANKVALITSEDMDFISILFDVNKNGKTTNIALSKATGSKEIDNLLLQLVKKMPNWEPAKNANGEPIQQTFMLRISNRGC